MSHPIRMLTDYELENFSRFIAANPHGPRVEGAFDSAPNRKYRGRRIPMSEFAPGGAYDTKPRRKHLGYDDITEVPDTAQADLVDDAAQADPADLEAFAKLAVRIARNMSGQAWFALYQKIQREITAADDPELAEIGFVARNRYTGKPKTADEYLENPTGGQPSAMDAAFAGFRIDTIGVQPQPKAQRITADAVASFAALFPGAIHGRR